MMGAICGDIAGSMYEWRNIKKKSFEIYESHCHFTDDTVATVAIAKAILNCNNDYGNDYENLTVQAEKCLREIGRRYPNCGWGERFRDWLFSDDHKPYKSLGNGAAMRVSPVAWAAKNLDECKAMSRAVTEITHNHREGIKGAETIAVCTYLARTGAAKNQIKAYARKQYDLDFTLDAIRPFYKFDVTCAGTVPPAIVAFLESENFDDAIRNAISIGGDSDTLAACTGAIAEAYYGINEDDRERCEYRFMPDDLMDIVREFEKKYRPEIL